MSELIIDGVVLIDSEGRLVEENLARFPCWWIGRRKVPAITDWRNAARRGGEKRAGHFMGVPTGAVNGIDGLDVDPAGMAWLEEALASGLVRPTRTHWTPRGGRHLIYRHAAGVRNKAGLFPGVDIRGEGGFLGWWPWAGYQVDDAPIAEWSEAMVALMVANATVGNAAGSSCFLASCPSASSRGSSSDRSRSSDRSLTDKVFASAYLWERTKRLRSRIEEILRPLVEAQPGERNHQINKVSFEMAGFVVERRLRREIAEGLVEQACKENGIWWEDGAEVCRKSIRSGMEAGLRKIVVRALA
jgi:hypothetical protein